MPEKKIGDVLESVCSKCEQKAMKLLTLAFLIKLGALVEPDPSKCEEDGKAHTFIWKEKSPKSDKAPQSGD